MKCIYCGSSTETYNSRSSSKNSSVWRRRQCKSCVAQFTTYEYPDYSSALSIEGMDGKLYPFYRDKLFLSIHRSLGHRKKATQESGDLLNTIVGKLLKDYENGAKIPMTDLARTTRQVLSRFDKFAGESYLAYHQAALKSK